MTDSARHTLARLALKALLLLVLLAALDIVYYFTLYPRDIEEHCDFMQLSRKPVAEGADMIYLGESSNGNYRDTDTDRRPISQMIEDQLPGHKIANLASNATHAGVFYDLMNNIPRHDSVRMAIVTVNMRSFTSEWIWSDLETPLRKKQVLMKRAPALYKRMLLAFKAYPHWEENERWAIVRRGIRHQTFSLPEPFPFTNAADWDSHVWTEGNQQGKNPDTLALACHYIKCFATTVDDRNPRIRDLDRIVRLCQRRGWQPVFHILPDNEDQMGAFVGPELLGLLHENARFVQQRYEAMGVTVVNNQGIVRDDDFNDKEYPTEHYDQVGRKAVADAVAEAVRSRLALQ